MACDVKGCIEQAKFHGRHVEVHRGVSGDMVFDDDEELKRFLDMSEEEKLDCTLHYKTAKNNITETLALVWGIDINFKGNYTEDYCRINNTLLTQRTAWCDKYQTTMWRQNDNWSGHVNGSRTVLQPLPDYVRWVKVNELHCLTLERNSRIVNTLKGRFTTMPGLFLPSRLFELFYEINPSPPDDIFSEISLLVWIPTHKVKRYLKEANEEDIHSFEQDKLKDKWKTTDLYKTNSCRELQDKCKKAGLFPVGLKHQLVQQLYENTTEKVLPYDFKSNYDGNVENLPALLKGLCNRSTVQIKYVLSYPFECQ